MPGTSTTAPVPSWVCTVRFWAEPCLAQHTWPVWPYIAKELEQECALQRHVCAGGSVHVMEGSGPSYSALEHRCRAACHGAGLRLCWVKSVTPRKTISCSLRWSNAQLSKIWLYQCFLYVLFSVILIYVSSCISSKMSTQLLIIYRFSKKEQHAWNMLFVQARLISLQNTYVFFPIKSSLWIFIRWPPAVVWTNIILLKSSKTHSSIRRMIWFSFKPCDQTLSNILVYNWPLWSVMVCECRCGFDYSYCL